MNAHLDKKILAKRLQMGKSFHQKHFDGEPVSVQAIQEKLKSVACDYQTNSWRNLRAAVACYWWQQGYQNEALIIRKTAKPRSENQDRHISKKRCKKITDDDWIKLLEAGSKSDNKLAFAVLILGFTTGMRPKEMTTFYPVSSNTLQIPSSKKREDRGLDRQIIIEDEYWARRINWAQGMTSGKPVRSLQGAFEYLVRQVFPARLSKPTIYSMRHQFGSNLKASGLDRRVVAYMMGHRATESVNKYGDRRAAGSGLPCQIKPAISLADIDRLVTVNHNRIPPHFSSEPFQPTIRR